MAAALLAERHPFRRCVLEGVDHGPSENAEEVKAMTRAWLNRYLQGGAARP